MADFEEARDKVMMGPERKSLLLSENERKLTAFHEAGHALVASMIPGADPLHKVTIVPRGRALGLTTQIPLDDKHSFSRTWLLGRIAVALGGRAAEKVVFNDLTTGAQEDIEKATTIARKMVCEWGMSEAVGPLAFGPKEEQIFLGREIAQHRDYSEQTAVLIDKEVRAVVDEALEKAEQIVAGNIVKLNDLANALLEREILDREEIEKIFRGEKLPASTRPANNSAAKPAGKSDAVPAGAPQEPPQGLFGNEPGEEPSQGEAKE
jgi:cell division protease FtsH